MWAIEDSSGPKATYRGGGIILNPAIVTQLYTSAIIQHVTMLDFNMATMLPETVLILAPELLI